MMIIFVNSNKAERKLANITSANENSEYRPLGGVIQVIAIGAEMWGSIPGPVSSVNSVANGSSPLQWFFGAVLSRR